MLPVDTGAVSDIPDIANTIAQTFSSNSSPENYSNKFQSFCRQAENQQLKFKSSNYEYYNNPFSLHEFTDPISKSHDTHKIIETVKHLLVECVDLKDVQNKHFVASSIKDLFDNIEAHKIIDFIKETRFISNFNVFILMFVICYLFFILA